jgi:hypothetical protein
VAKGMNGADLIHRVRNKNGHLLWHHRLGIEAHQSLERWLASETQG